MGITIFIVADAPLVRERLVQLIEENEGMTVIGHTDSAHEAGQRIIASRPDVALLDVHLQHDNAFSLLDQLQQQVPRTQVVLLTANPFPGYQVKALAMGAIALLDQNQLGEQLLPLLHELNAADRQVTNNAGIQA